jgi:hypothetical protein
VLVAHRKAVGRDNAIATRALGLVKRDICPSQKRVDGVTRLPFDRADAARDPNRFISGADGEFTDRRDVMSEIEG